jgi:hypothetical protein
MDEENGGLPCHEQLEKISGYMGVDYFSVFKRWEDVIGSKLRQRVPLNIRTINTAEREGVRLDEHDRKMLVTIEQWILELEIMGGE